MGICIHCARDLVQLYDVSRWKLYVGFVFWTGFGIGLGFLWGPLLALLIQFFGSLAAFGLQSVWISSSPLGTIRRQAEWLSGADLAKIDQVAMKRRVLWTLFYPLRILLFVLEAAMEG